MDSPTSPSQPQTIPVERRVFWLKALLAGLAAGQWLLAAALTVFFPPSWDSLFGQPVGPLAAGAVGLAGALSAAAGAAWAIPNEALQRAYRAVERVSRSPLWTLVPLGLATLAVLAGQFLYGREWFGYAVMAIQLGGAALFCYWLAPAAWENRPKTLVISAMIVLALGLVIRLGFVFADFIWTDEGFHLSATAGMLQGKTIAPETMRFPDNILIGPWRGFLFGLYAPWARLFGLGLTQQRMLAYVVGLIALALTFETVRLWYGRATAWVTTGLIGLSFLFLQSTRARCDTIPLAAVALTVWALTWADRKTNHWPHVLVGLLAVLSLEGHFVNLIFFPVWGGFYAVDYLKRAIKAGRPFINAPLWYFLIGFLPGMAAYLVVHVLLLPHPEAWLANTQGVAGGEGSFLAGRFGVYVERWRIYAEFAPLDLALIAAALVAALIRRTAPDRRWLLLFGLSQVGYLAAAPQAEISHTIYGIPFFFGAAGALVTYGLGQEERPGRPVARIMLYGIALALTIHGVGTARLRDQVRRSWADTNQPTVSAVRERIPPGANLIAPPSMIPYLVEYHFLHPYYWDVIRGPALAGEEVLPYWQNVLLETWPAAQIKRPSQFRELPIFASYIRALDAEEVVDDLWVIDQAGLVTDAPYAALDPSAALQMVAHRRPEVDAGGGSLTVHTVWVTRGELSGDYVLRAALVDAGGAVVAQSEAAMLGSQGEPTGAWTPYEFEGVDAAIPLADDLAGEYTLRLAVADQGGTPPAACGAGCVVEVGTVRIGEQ